MYSLIFLFKCKLVKKHFRYFNSNRELSISLLNKPTLYGDIASPPVRFALMTASYLDIELEFHKIDLFKGENKSDFYRKINPLQKVPALCVGNETICDSHAIALYLCKISTDQELYPAADAKMKAKVDEMLFFNAGALFPLDSILFTEYFAGKWPVSEDQVERWNFLLDYMEKVLSRNLWLTGQKMTLCDICCAATVSSLHLLLPPEARHKRVNLWIKRIQLFAFYNINTEGLNRLKHFVNEIKINEF